MPLYCSFLSVTAPEPSFPLKANADVYLQDHQIYALPVFKEAAVDQDAVLLLGCWI